MDKRKVVVFGGAFSPPTLAHEAIIAALLEIPQFDEVWVMPSGDRIDKEMSARDSDCIAMLQVMQEYNFADKPRLRITDFELQMPRPSQTSETVKSLERTFPDIEFWFAYGPDSYVSMPSWPDGAALQQKIKVVLFSSGGPAVQAKGELVRLDISDEFGETSSTEARRLAATGQSPASQVSGPVARYIAEHHLYET